MYLIPFYQDANGVQYFGELQYHLYYTPIEDNNADVTLQCDTYQHFDGLGAVLEPSYSGRCFDMTNAQIPFCLGISCGFYDLSYYSLVDYSNCKETTSRSFSAGTGAIVPFVNLLSSRSEAFSLDNSTWYKFHKSYENTTLDPDQDAVCRKSPAKAGYQYRSNEKRYRLYGWVMQTRSTV